MPSVALKETEYSGDCRSLYDLFASMQGKSGLLKKAARRAGLSDEYVDDLEQELFFSLSTITPHGDLHFKQDLVSNLSKIKTIAERTASELRRKIQHSCSFTEHEWKKLKVGREFVSYSLTDLDDDRPISGGLSVDEELDGYEEESVIDEIDYDRIIAVMDRVSLADRQVIRDLLNGESVEAICDRWGTSVKAVYQSARRIREAMEEINTHYEP